MINFFILTLRKRIKMVLFYFNYKPTYFGFDKIKSRNLRTHSYKMVLIKIKVIVTKFTVAIFCAQTKWNGKNENTKTTVLTSL